MDDQKRGEFLLKLRKEKKLTQKELGDLIHFSDKNISKWERGESFPKSPDILNDLSNVLGVTTEELMRGERIVEKENHKKLVNECIRKFNEYKSELDQEYSQKYKRYKKRLLIIMSFILSLLVVICLLVYFIFIRNSFSVYKITADNTILENLNALLISTNDSNYLMMNDIDLENDEQVKLLELNYVDDDGHKNLIYSGDMNIFISEENGYGEYNLDKIKDNDFILTIIYKDDTTEDIVLKLDKIYSNSSIFPRKAGSISNDNYSLDENTDLFSKLNNLGFENVDQVSFEKKLDDNIIISINSWNGNISMFINNDDILENIITNVNEDVIYYERKSLVNDAIDREEIRLTDKKDCDEVKCSVKDDYIMYVNYLKSELW